MVGVLPHPLSPTHQREGFSLLGLKADIIDRPDMPHHALQETGLDWKMHAQFFNVKDHLTLAVSSLCCMISYAPLYRKQLAV